MHPLDIGYRSAIRGPTETVGADSGSSAEASASSSLVAPAILCNSALAYGREDSIAWSRRAMVRSHSSCLL